MNTSNEVGPRQPKFASIIKLCYYPGYLMPSKHAVKTYIEQGIYHVYNRGVEKRSIFMDESDYKLFLYFLKRYLTDDVNEVRPRWRKDLFRNISLLSYCLMENHFHLLLKQESKESMTIFMRCLSNSYTKYFNQKYNRVGPLFQGKFKAILVQKDEYLLHLTRYIHLNPIGNKTITRSDLVTLKNAYSSLLDYFGERNTEWVHPEVILDYFSLVDKKEQMNKYKSFVQDFLQGENEIIENYSIDET